MVRKERTKIKKKTKQYITKKNFLNKNYYLDIYIKIYIKIIRLSKKFFNNLIIADHMNF